MIEVGKKAPLFTLPRDSHGPDGEGGKIALKDLRGKWVVLYFYPKDLTSGCTTQAIDLTDQADEFKKRDAIIIGISPDSAARTINSSQKTRAECHTGRR